MGVLSLTLLTLWLGALSIHLLGVFRAQKHFEDQPIPADTPFRLIPVTILKPLKGLDEGFKENIESFFDLDYPEFEIIFSVADRSDPAARVVRQLIEENPKVQARLVVGEVNVGKNPKINNLVQSYDLAQYGWILISDSNVRVRPGYLKKLVSQVDSDTGMLTSVILGTGARGLGGKLEELHLNTFYAKGMTLAAWLNQDCVVGKSMLFRKTSAERFGGLRALGGFLAEDYMAGEAMKHLGLKVVTAWEAVPQFIGNYSLTEFWNRHLRWGRIRKAQAPLPFIAEALAYSILPGILGAYAAAALFRINPFLFFSLHLMIWAVLDLAIMKSMGATIRRSTVFYWILREVFALPLWVNVACGSSVVWRGEKYRLRMGGLLVAQKV